MSGKDISLQLELKRTKLAQDRTVLAFVRTGLAFILFGAVLLGFSEAFVWLKVVGSSSAGIGVAFILFSVYQSAKYKKEFNGK